MRQDKKAHLKLRQKRFKPALRRTHACTHKHALTHTHTVPSQEHTKRYSTILTPWHKHSLEGTHPTAPSHCTLTLKSEHLFVLRTFYQALIPTQTHPPHTHTQAPTPTFSLSHHIHWIVSHSDLMPFLIPAILVPQKYVYDPKQWFHWKVIAASKSIVSWNCSLHP